MANDVADEIEHTLSTIAQAHVYKLPPRPDTRGWNCQAWPKENHIFTGRVVIVALGTKCTIRLIDKENGKLFAQCPLDNDNPTLSVEPVLDSSRYFVLRVSDGSGRHAYLGMGFLERSDAFEFNVTLQDHVKHIKNEQAAKEAASKPQPPPQDFTLKGSVNIALPGGAKASGVATDPFANAFGDSSGFGPSSTFDASTAVDPANLFGAPPSGSSSAPSVDPFGTPSSASDPFGFGALDGALPSTDPFGSAPPPPPPAPAGGGPSDWVAFG